MPLQIHQERLGPAAAADRWGSTADQGNVVQSDDVVVSRDVHDWAQRLSERQPIIQQHNSRNFHPASGDTSLNRKSKKRSSRQV